ncbi:hypothetical protein MCEMSE15_02538 [Fimbriimonadaceae bacterium]
MERSDLSWIHLGWDGRVADYVSDYPVDIRLSMTAKRMLSVDKMIWPRSAAFLQLLKTNEDLGRNWTLNLYPHSSVVSELPSTTAVRISCLASQTEIDPERFYPASGGEEEVIILGYEVADIWLLSGVMNIVYSEEDRVAWPQFVSVLNENHLFDDPRLAIEFAEVLDDEVTEHAPFVVLQVAVLAS